MKPKFICEKCANKTKLPIPKYWYDFMPMWDKCSICGEEGECIPWNERWRKYLKGKNE